MIARFCSISDRGDRTFLGATDLPQLSIVPCSMRAAISVQSEEPTRSTRSMSGSSPSRENLILWRRAAIGRTSESTMRFREADARSRSPSGRIESESPKLSSSHPFSHPRSHERFPTLTFDDRRIEGLAPISGDLCRERSEEDFPSRVPREKKDPHRRDSFPQLSKSTRRLIYR
jgi:hypothetical protein